MADASAFRYYDDPVNQAGPSEIFLSLAETFSGPGLIAAPFEVAPLLAQAIRELADQVLTDQIGETTKAIYLANGTLWQTISCTIAGGVVTTITVGSVAYGVAKARDLALGLDAFIA